MVNLYLIEFAINALLRNKTKNTFIVVLLSLIIFLLSSIFQVSNGIKKELLDTVDSLPEITIQNLEAGRTINIELNAIDHLLQINGISSVTSRVWGYYYFANKNSYFTLIGIDQFDNQYKQLYENLTNKYDFDQMNNGMIVGNGVKKLLQESYYNDYFNFIKQNGENKRVSIIGSFDRDTTLQTNDVILMPKNLVYEIFGINPNVATDIVVKVENKEEIDTVATKIKVLFPTYRVITKEELRRSYEEMFSYKSGIFLGLFIVCLFSFFMIVYDKGSGLNSEEKKEIGILKAVGWSTNDILKWKFYESFILSSVSYLLGFISSFFYVHILHAPLLKELFLGSSDLKPDFQIPFVLDISLLVTVFFIAIPIYIAATIFPSWRASTVDADEVLR